MLASWVGGEQGLGYVSCFRDFDVCSICRGVRCCKWEGVL